MLLAVANYAALDAEVMLHAKITWKFSVRNSARPSARGGQKFVWADRNWTQPALQDG